MKSPRYSYRGYRISFNMKRYAWFAVSYDRSHGLMDYTETGIRRKVDETIAYR